MNWISVKEKLPEERQCVIIYGKWNFQRDDACFVASVVFEDGKFLPHNHDDRLDDDHFIATHWMPLPEPPRQEQVSKEVEPAVTTSVWAGEMVTLHEAEPKKEKRDACGGDGYYKGPRLGDEPCPKCKGHGWIRTGEKS
jgi:hypothetical protein